MMLTTRIINTYLRYVIEMIWQRDHVFCFARMLGSRNLRGVAMLVAMR